MKYTELKKLIVEEIEAVKAEMATEKNVANITIKEVVKKLNFILKNTDNDILADNVKQWRDELNKKIQNHNTPTIKEDMMADPVSISFFIGTVATLVTGFTAAVWKGMKDNEKQKLTKAVKELKPKEVKAIAEKAVEEVHAN